MPVTKKWHGIKQKHIRIFVAFPLIKDLLDLYSDYILNFRNIPGLRWTKRENLHLTLFFIGEIEESNLPHVIEQIKILRESFKPFLLEFEKISYRGKAHKPGMIWAQYQKAESFNELSQVIYKSVSGFMTINPQYLDPIPHVTLARLKKDVDLSSVRANELNFPALLKVDKMELWMTVQTVDGVVYKSIG